LSKGKNMNIKLLSMITILTTALLFSACGGGGDDASFRNGEEKITVIECNATVANIPDDYTTMLSGDVLVNQTDDTVITTYHDINATKKVCTVSGKAYLIRK